MSARSPHQVLLKARTTETTRLDLYVAAILSRSTDPISGGRAVDLALALIEQVDDAGYRVISGGSALHPHEEGVAGPVASPASTSLAPAQAGDAETKLAAIRTALADYRTALRNRLHAGLAAHTFVDAAAAILGESASP